MIFTKKLQHPTLEIEAKKINQKLKEAKYNPGDVTPLADCMLALMLAAKNQGYSVKALFQKFNHVAEEIGSKHWKKMPDGTYHAS